MSLPAAPGFLALSGRSRDKILESFVLVSLAARSAKDYVMKDRIRAAVGSMVLPDAEQCHFGVGVEQMLVRGDPLPLACGLCEIALAAVDVVFARVLNAAAIHRKAAGKGDGKEEA